MYIILRLSKELIETNKTGLIIAEIIYIYVAKEVIFSSALGCLFAGLRKNYSIDFHKIRRNVQHVPS